MNRDIASRNAVRQGRRGQHQPRTRVGDERGQPGWGRQDRQEIRGAGLSVAIKATIRSSDRSNNSATRLAGSAGHEYPASLRANIELPVRDPVIPAMTAVRAASSAPDVEKGDEVVLACARLLCALSPRAHSLAHPASPTAACRSQVNRPERRVDQFATSDCLLPRNDTGVGGRIAEL
jgi:hypothetical protein